MHDIDLIGAPKFQIEDKIHIEASCTGPRRAARGRVKLSDSSRHNANSCGLHIRLGRFIFFSLSECNYRYALALLPASSLARAARPCSVIWPIVDEDEAAAFYLKL